MPDLPNAVVDRLRPHVGDIRRSEPVGGGCIANAMRIEAGGTRYFLKWSGGEAGQTFEAEAAGLRALRNAASPLLVPDVMATWNADDTGPGALLMGWIEPGRTDAAFWERFGEALAALHRSTPADGRYGFERDNFIGRTPQPNAWRMTWPNFFRSQRLEPQIALARSRGGWRERWNAPAERLLDRLPEWLPVSPPASILHGDLWSGNFLPASDGCAALIDPATYYGHRETDLALTELFGGFDRRFYDAYRAAWPLEPGYAARREVYNLYHLLNHLNLFGAGYAGQVERTLRRFA
ncbi:MAG: fructosamine kinase family protein [Rhodothermales bacterium]